MFKNDRVRVVFLQLREWIYPECPIRKLFEVADGRPVEQVGPRFYVHFVDVRGRPRNHPGTRRDTSTWPPLPDFLSSDLDDVPAGQQAIVGNIFLAFVLALTGDDFPVGFGSVAVGDHFGALGQP
jgi:hypothetical protein